VYGPLQYENNLASILASCQGSRTVWQKESSGQRALAPPHISAPRRKPHRKPTTTKAIWSTSPCCSLRAPDSISHLRSPDHESRRPPRYRRCRGPLPLFRDAFPHQSQLFGRLCKASIAAQHGSGLRRCQPQHAPVLLGLRQRQYQYVAIAFSLPRQP
jgi:hypothetical protein